jgi:hypothetical protein
MPCMQVDFAMVLTVLKHTPAREALTEIDKEAGKKAASFNPQDFSKFLHALADLRHKPVAFLQGASPVVTGMLWHFLP